MVGKAITNPFAALRVGSTAFGHSGEFKRPVLRGDVTQMLTSEAGSMSMSGNSDYVYADNMNQGSMAASGSYGADGISKLEGSLSAYVGRTHSNTGNEMTITVNMVKCGGVEYLDLDSLKMDDLVAALADNVAATLEEALDAFMAVEEARKSEDEAKQSAAMTTWIKKSGEFLQSNGTGLVIGILWGGWGSVAVTFKTDHDATRWKGGGEGTMSYSGTTASIAVSAAYGHEESNVDASGTAEVKGYYNGACVADRIEKWQTGLSELATKGISELAKTPLTRFADFDKPVATPSVPPLTKPKKKGSVAGKITQIKDLEGLEAYALASAFDKQKGTPNGTDDLTTFMEEQKKKNVVDLPTAAQLVGDSDDGSMSDDAAATPPPRPSTPAPAHKPAARASGQDMSASIAAGAGFLGAAGAMAAMPAGTGTTAKEAETPGETEINIGSIPGQSDQFEPMGVWITPWAALFPWLVTGNDNRITADVPSVDGLSVTIAQQDFLTLYKLFRRLDAEKLKLVKYDANGRSQPSKAFSLKAIGDRFQNAYGICVKWAEERATGKSTTTSDQILEKATTALGRHAGKVYETFTSVPALRKCELGAGVLIRDLGTDETVSISEELSPAELLAVEPNDFDPDRKDYIAFSRNRKAWPVPLPDGRIILYVPGIAHDFDFSPMGSLFTVFNRFPHGIQLSNELRAEGDARDRGEPMTLVWDDEADCLWAPAIERPKDKAQRNFRVEVYPLPPSVLSKDVTWRGCALGTGFGNFSKQLEELRTQLMDLPAWSMESDYWTGVDLDHWRYSITQLPKSYVGLVDEPENVF